MAGMTIRDRVRQWLGLDELKRLILESDWEVVELRRQAYDLRDVCNRMETGEAATERHTELISALTELRAWMSEQSLAAHGREEDRHGELIELLTKLEQHFVSKHVGRPTTSIPVYDWEQVQIQELAEMLANPPKEEN